MARFSWGASVAVVALLLTGCTPEPEPVASPTAEPAPEPTVEPALRPNPVFAIDCAEIFSLDEVQAAVAAPVEVKRDESSVPAEFWELPLLSEGALSCRWGGDSRTGATYDDGLDVDVRPGGEAAFDALVTSGYEQPVTVAGADEAVSTNCAFGSRPDAVGAPGFCTIIARNGDRVLVLRYSDSVQVFAAETDITTVAVDLTETALERIIAADDVDQAWQAPSDSVVADEAFCESAGPQLLAALSVETDFGGVSDPFFGDPRVRACEYYFGATDVSSVSIWIVQGAAWAAGVEQTEGPALGQPYESQVTASGAEWWLSPSGQAVQGRGAIDGSLVEVVVYWGDIDATVERAQAAVTDFMEEYAEAPPGR